MSVGGESGVDARPCDYDWVLSLREQWVAHGILFRFLDYKIGKYLVPETMKFEWKVSDYHD